MDEAGDPRGEFIRLQIEIARQPHQAVALQKLLTRQSELLIQNRRRWNGPIHQYLGVNAGLRSRRRRAPIRGWEYRRGFPSVITLCAAPFATWHDTILRIGPIEHVRFLDAQDYTYSLFALPAVQSLTGLSLRFDWPNLRRSNEIFAALVNSPNLHGLRTLELFNIEIGHRASGLFIGPSFSQLETLNLKGCNVQTSVAMSLIERFGDGVTFGDRTVDQLRNSRTVDASASQRVRGFFQRFLGR